jgi:ABC-type protease/lipase transport system fused ATPase/permease subunit
VTHRNTLIRHVDQMMVLEAGRVQQYGPTAQVLVALDRQRQRPPVGNVVRMSRPAEPQRKEQNV